MILTLLKAIPVAIATLLLSLVALISIPLDRSGKTYHWSAKTWARIILWVYRIRITVRGQERLDPARHYIYVSNHASGFDIPVVLAGINDQIRIVLKKELTRIPIWGWALKWGYYIPIDRSNPKTAVRSLEDAAQRMREGASVLLFAEGTRTLDGNLQQFKRGAFSLAVKSEVPVVPLTINHSFGIQPKGTLQVRGGSVVLVLGDPIPTSGPEGITDDRRLMERVHQVIATHYVTPPSEPEQA
jgi:1-acyl-sn-glycerol-3-phosphate acyltransferase